MEIFTFEEKSLSIRVVEGITLGSFWCAGISIFIVEQSRRNRTNSDKLERAIVKVKLQTEVNAICRLLEFDHICDFHLSSNFLQYGFNSCQLREPTMNSWDRFLVYAKHKSESIVLLH